MSLYPKKRKLCLILALCSVFMATWFVFKNKQGVIIESAGKQEYMSESENMTGDRQQLLDSQLQLDRGLFNFTVVSGMFDIGRGNWSKLKRTYDQYLKNMQQVLSLKVNLVLYVDAKAKAFTEERRRGMEKRTKIIETRLQDTPYYKLRPRMVEIMNSSKYKLDNELFKRALPEALFPDYDLVNWNKLYFVDRTIKENPFKNDYFLWLDGGYGHGKAIFPENHIWKPRGLFEHADKVTFIELSPGVGKYKKDMHKLHKMSIAILIGGFFAGGKSALQELYRQQKNLVSEWMNQGIVDDDQTINLFLFYKNSSLFHLVPGGWYDVFKLFNYKE